MPELVGRVARPEKTPVPAELLQSLSYYAGHTVHTNALSPADWKSGNQANNRARVATIDASVVGPLPALVMDAVTCAARSRWTRVGSGWRQFQGAGSDKMKLMFGCHTDGESHRGAVSACLHKTTAQHVLHLQQPRAQGFGGLLFRTPARVLVSNKTV